MAIFCVGAEEEEIGKRERISGTEQGAQGGNLAPLLRPIGAGLPCRWPPPLPRCLVATGRYRSWPLRPHATTAGGCGDRASAKLQTTAARAGGAAASPSAQGPLLLHRAGMPQQLRRSTEAWPGNGWGGAYRRRGSRGARWWVGWSTLA